MSQDRPHTIHALLQTRCGCERTMVLQHFIPRIEIRMLGRMTFSVSESMDPLESTPIERRVFLYERQLSDGQFLFMEEHGPAHQPARTPVRAGVVPRPSGVTASSRRPLSTLHPLVQLDEQLRG